MEKNTNLGKVICEIYYAETKNISSITQSDKTKTVSFETGDWSKFYFTPGKASFSEPFVNSDAGGYYDQKLDIFFPGVDNEDTLSSFDLFEKKRLILKIVYQSGVTKILGDLNYPVLAEKNYSDNDQGSKILFNCKYPDRAFMLV